MPMMDGLAATAAIREREKITGGHIPIIAMTANAMEGDREVCLDAGMDDYVAKPVRSRDLFEALERYAPAGRPAGDAKPSAGSQPAEAAQPKREVSPASEVFDRAEFARETADPDLMRSLVDIFGEDYPGLLEAIESALAAGDAEALHKAAHGLKGMIGNYQARGPLAAVAALDARARKGDLAREHLSGVRKATEQLHRAPQDFRNEIEGD